jgi:hypothetical protein
VTANDVTLVDRTALAAKLVQALDDASEVIWPVGNNEVPTGGGGDPAGTYQPYIIVWTLNTTTTASMSHSDANNQTPFQLTCASSIPESSSLTGRASIIGQRAVAAVKRARRAGALDTPTQKVTLAKIDSIHGPFRDPDDDRIRVVHALLRFQTQPIDPDPEDD